MKHFQLLLEKPHLNNERVRKVTGTGKGERKGNYRQLI